MWDVFGGNYSDSREWRMTEYIMRFPMSTWEFLAGECFRREREKALEEVKKHFKRKLGAYHMAGNFVGC